MVYKLLYILFENSAFFQLNGKSIFCFNFNELYILNFFFYSNII